MNKITGRITLIAKHYQNLDDRSPGEMRFIKVANNPQIFEFYVGKPGGDNRPKLEKLDSLKTGDIVTLFCIKDFLNCNGEPDQVVQFIDRQKQPVYISNNGGRTLLLGLAMFCALCMGGLFVLKNEGHII